MRAPHLLPCLGLGLLLGAACGSDGVDVAGLGTPCDVDGAEDCPAQLTCKEAATHDGSSELCLLACEAGSCPDGYFCAGADTCGDITEIGPSGFCAEYGRPDRYEGVDLGPHRRSCDEETPCPEPYRCVAAPGSHSPGPSCLLPCNGGDCPAVTGFFCAGIDACTDAGRYGYCADV